jgi:hypothetical protein
MTGIMGGITIGSANTEIDHSVQIKLGSGASSEFGVLGAKLLIWLNAHIHPGGSGPTGPPQQPATVGDFGSTKVFLE